MDHETINSLEEIRALDSGLKSFAKDKFQAKLKTELLKQSPESSNTDYLGLLSLFLLRKNQELHELFKSHPELITSTEAKAIKLLNLLELDDKIVEAELFPFPSRDSLIHKKLANNLSSSLVDLFFSIKKNTNSISKTTEDLWPFIETLPELFYFLAKQVLIDNEKSFFEKISLKIQELKNRNSIENEIYQDQEIKQLEEARLLYLEILLSQRSGEGNLDKLLLKYHQIYKPDLEKKSKIISNGVKQYHRPDKVLSQWSSILEEANSIQNEIETLANILPSTCDYFSCSDCCSMTFPTMSYTEYLYLKDWMKKNKLDENLIKEKSEKIQKDYEEKFGERLKIIDKSKIENQIRGIENPHDYKFSCPFLTEDGKCSCHPARPLLCRGFGTATNNGVSIKTCNYYLKQYQHNSSPENERHVFDMRPMEMLIRSSDKHFYKEGQSKDKEASGTIVAWFSD